MAHGRDTSTDAVARLRRLLLALPHLADDQRHSLDDVAAAAGTDVPTLVSDLTALTRQEDFGPGGFVEGITVYLGPDTVTARSSFFKRPMGLTGHELIALELGLAVLAAERPPEERAAIVRARDRVARARAGLPGEAHLPVVADLGAHVDAAVLDAVRRAAATRRRVRITYHGANAPAPTERRVAPYAVVYARGAWYVVGHDDRADGLRVFRVDRVGSAVLTDETFGAPESFTLDDLAADGRMLMGPMPDTVTIRYSPAIARWVAEREVGREEPDGSFVVDHPLADPHWAVRHVLQYGPDAEVLAPEEVRALVRERLARILHDAGGG